MAIETPRERQARIAGRDQPVAPPAPPPAPPAPAPQPAAAPPPPPAYNPQAGGVPQPPRPAPPPPPASGGQDLSGFSSFAEWQAANQAAGGRGLASAYEASGGTLQPGEQDQFNVGQGRADGSTGAPNNQAQMTPDQRVDYAMQNIDDLSAHGDPNRAREQWKIWQRSFDPACPGESPYQAEDGSGCVEKPDNSNTPGAGGRQNLPGGVAGNQGGGGGGAGGGAGGATSSTTASSTPGGQGGISDTIWDQIRGDLDGGPSRYSDENVAAIEADQFARARRQEALQLEESRRDSAISGTSRSGGAQAARRGIRAGTGQQILANRSQIQQGKIQADFEDRQAAIKNAQNHLNSLRQYMLQSDMNSIQREQLSAQIAMANKQLAWQTTENDRAHQRGLEERSLFDPNSPLA